TIAILGDTVNTGKLTLNGTLDFGTSTARTLTLQSDVVLGGPLQTSGGGLSTINGNGRLVIKGQGKIANGAPVLVRKNPAVVGDGGNIVTGDGWRIVGSGGVTVLLAVTNGGALYITNSATENIRVGFGAADLAANNVLDVAGILTVTGNAANGGIVMGG